jgi:hypothetical protein
MQANSNLVTSLLNLLLNQSGGVSFWDSGAMQDRLYSGSGIHLLNIFELPGIILNPTRLAWGDLNLVGLTNPISLLAPKRILYGDISYWTTSDHIVWSDDITSPEGQHIVWSDTDSTDDYHIVWSDSMMDSSNAH